MGSYKPALWLLILLLAGMPGGVVSAHPPAPFIVRALEPPEAALADTRPPESAAVTHIFGYGQLMALSCESRAAADWARHFGITIHELDFFFRLPKTANPETGFVGSVNDGWGNLPPQGYGVHAVPVAQVLRDYGAQAVALRNMTLDQLRAEIAADKPVIVWVTGHVEPGTGVDLLLDGQTVRVARYEHTVIVTGYDATTVTILDGKTVYQRRLETFLAAWAPLENMAIIWDAGFVPSSSPSHAESRVGEKFGGT